MCYPYTKRAKLDTWKRKHGYIQDAGLGNLGELCYVGKLCPQKGENLVFQGGAELPVLQTHYFMAIWETAQSQSNLLLELQLVPVSGVLVVPLSPMLTMWALVTACSSPLLSLRVRTTGPEQEKLLCKTQNISVSSLWNPFTLLVSPKGSCLQEFVHRQFVLPPLPYSPNDLAGGDLGQEELLFYTTKSPAPVRYAGRQSLIPFICKATLSPGLSSKEAPHIS